MKPIFLLFTSVVFFLMVYALRPSDVETSAEAKKSKAEKIVAKAIKAHGGEVLDAATVRFDFRNRHYVATRRGGDYTYERHFEEAGQQINDILSNEGFVRKVDGVETPVTQERKDAFSNSVNSVIYFALLPYNLQDAAVNKQYLGEEIINNRNYHKIKVTFQQDGGGKDYDDEYIYWIHEQNYTMDYLAYNYQVEGGGARFRAAYNVRKVQGVRFADYVNYRPMNEHNHAVETFAQLFQNQQLKELSKIETENIELIPLKEK